MNIHNLLKLAVLAVAVFVGVLTNATEETRAASSSTLASPRSLYNQNCATCHGANGHSDTPKGRETGADDLTTGGVKGMNAAKMTQIIKNGRGDMPAFGKKLTAAQITQVIRYVKSL